MPGPEAQLCPDFRCRWVETSVETRYVPEPAAVPPVPGYSSCFRTRRRGLCSLLLNPGGLAATVEVLLSGSTGEVTKGSVWFAPYCLGPSCWSPQAPGRVLRLSGCPLPTSAPGSMPTDSNCSLWSDHNRPSHPRPSLGQASRSRIPHPL